MSRLLKIMSGRFATFEMGRAGQSIYFRPKV